ncbi:MAG: hypothetical protein WKF56_04980, partial [Candidatus Limnocylindrales bacterium]
MKRLLSLTLVAGLALAACSSGGGTSAPSGGASAAASSAASSAPSVDASAGASTGASAGASAGASTGASAGASADASAGASSAGGEGGLIGIAMPTKSSARWIADGDNLVKALTDLGYETDLQFAEDDIPTQVSQ